jgi:hypothetical protein
MVSLRERLTPREGQDSTLAPSYTLGLATRAHTLPPQARSIDPAEEKS